MASELTEHPEQIAERTDSQEFFSSPVASAPPSDAARFTEEESGHITRLLSDVKEHYGGTYPPQFARCRNERDLRVLASKYLKGRKWSCADALAMVIDTMKFREENKLDGMALFPCPFPIFGYDQADINRRLELPEREGDELDLYYKGIGPYYAASMHYWDKDGHPLVCGLMNNIDVRALYHSLEKYVPVGKTFADEARRYFVYLNEVIIALEDYLRILYDEEVERRERQTNGAEGDPATAEERPRCLQEVQHPIYHFSVLMDGTGLHMGMLYLPMMEIVRAVLPVLGQHYPDNMFRMVVINSPLIIRFAYSLVKGALPDGIKGKIMFCKKADSMDALKTLLKDDMIPNIFDGPCDCAGGCVPYLDTKHGLDADSTLDLQTEEVNVGAGKVYTVSYILEEGERVKWHFIPVNTDDMVQFSATFEPISTSSTDVQEAKDTEEKKTNKKTTSISKKKSSKGDKETSVTVVEAEKVKETSGEYVATKAGTLNLMWDNSSSWMHGKKIHMRVVSLRTGESTPRFF